MIKLMAKGFVVLWSLVLGLILSGYSTHLLAESAEMQKAREQRIQMYKALHNPEIDLKGFSVLPSKAQAASDPVLKQRREFILQSLPAWAIGEGGSTSSRPSAASSSNATTSSQEQQRETTPKPSLETPQQEDSGFSYGF